jgi:hypothetical protein
MKLLSRARLIKEISLDFLLVLLASVLCVGFALQ